MNDFTNVRSDSGSVAEAMIKECTRVQCDNVMWWNLHDSSTVQQTHRHVRVTKEGYVGRRWHNQWQGCQVLGWNTRMLAASEFPDVLGRTWCTWVSGALAVPVPRNSQTSLWRMEITVKVGDMLMRQSWWYAKRGTRTRPTQERQKISVIPYVHGVSHALKKIVGKAGVKLVFSAPRKLGRLCKKVNVDNTKEQACVKKHRTQYVECVSNVVYDIPLSCGLSYTGQTGRCLNDRLREHANNLRTSTSSTLAAHCSLCGCAPLFHECKILSRYRNKTEREINEAFHIKTKGDMSVSEPSLALLEKEIMFLSS